MARMYPDHLDERTRSQAERTLYTAFAQQFVNVITGWRKDSTILWRNTENFLRRKNL
jgi:hypothetical protein